MSREVNRTAPPYTAAPYPVAGTTTGTTGAGRADASGAYVPVVPAVAGAAPLAGAATVAQPTVLGTAPIGANVVPAAHTAHVAAPVAPAVAYPAAPVAYPTTGVATAPVGAPVVVAAKEIAAGRMPPNAAIQDVLTTARQTIEAEKAVNPALAQGVTANKLENAILATQSHLAEKNADEKYQRFVAHSAQAATTGAAVGGQTLSAAGGPAVQSTQNLPPMGQFLRTLASSAEFRTTLSSAWTWLQHVLAGTLTAPTSAPKTSVLTSALAGNAPNEGAANAQDAMWLNFSQFIRVLGSHPDYQRAIEGLFMFIEQMCAFV